jgi:hypothetical protein
MLDTAFSSLYGSTDSALALVSPKTFLICCAVSIVLGACVALIYMFKHHAQRNFVITLALLPLIVQMVITLVNGNLGAGIAVMGVFNLVRFRSVPGSAKDIGAVFLAMAVGLATGMGYVTVAVLFVIIVGIVNAIYMLSPFGKQENLEKTLRITVPEDFDFNSIFDEVLSSYASRYELVEVKTTNMGSLYQLEYQLQLRHAGSEKHMIDQLRCLNGNLKISCGRPTTAREVL